jgi:hypothetical protein
MAVGLAIGLIMGVGIGNPGVGIVLGVALGAGLEAEGRKRRDS